MRVISIEMVSIMGGEEGVLREEIKELSGVVYIMNRICPRWAGFWGFDQLGFNRGLNRAWVKDANPV